MPPREPFDTREREKEYPEPSMFGMLPAYGFFVRHVRGVEVSNVEVHVMKEDGRPAFVLDEVRGARFQDVRAQKGPARATFVLKKVEEFETRGCGVPDVKVGQADRREL